MGIRQCFSFFCKTAQYLKKQSQNEHLCQFSDKRDEKVVHDKIYLLKFEFYNTDRKMKSTIGCIFISIIMYPNFMCFRQKISFKKRSVRGHLRTALTQIINADISGLRNVKMHKVSMKINEQSLIFHREIGASAWATFERKPTNIK